MGYFTTPAALAMRQRARFALAGRDMVKVHKILAESGYRDELSQTSGRLTSNQLAALGHPFARGVGGAQRGTTVQKAKKYLRAGKKGQVKKSGVVPRLPINRQTGDLRTKIRLTGPSGMQLVYDLFSDSPHASFVLSPNGTKFMVPRGLLGPTGVLRKRHKARVQTYIDVVRKSLRTP